MTRSSEARIIRKRARKFHKFVPILSQSHDCEHCDVCNDCMDAMQAQVDRDRPGHAWRTEKGQIIYMEDAVVEHHLGRKLEVTEQIVHKNGNVLDNRMANLEIVKVERLEE